MFDIGFTELMLLGVVALLILGPERLPAAARTAGALLRRARNSYQTLKTDIERELAVDEMKAGAKAMAEPLQSIKDTAAQLNRGAADLRDELKRSDPIAEPAVATDASSAAIPTVSDAEKVAAAAEDADDALAVAAQVQAAPKAKAKSETQPKPKPRAKRTAPAASKAKPKAPAKPRAKAETKAKPKASAKAETKTKPKAPAKPRASGESKPGAKTPAKARRKAAPAAAKVEKTADE